MAKSSVLTTLWAPVRPDDDAAYSWRVGLEEIAAEMINDGWTAEDMDDAWAEAIERNKETE